MIIYLLLTPLLGIISLLFVVNEEKIKQITLFTSILTFAVSLKIYLDFNPSTITYQFVEKFTSLGFLELQFGVDGISLYFIMLTTFLTPIIILASWANITKDVKTYIILQLIIELILVMIFSVIDFFLFYITFEAVLIPLFFVVGIWGGAGRIRASMMFFLYTLIGSLFMLLSIVMIYNKTGTSDFSVLSSLNFDVGFQKLMFLGFFISFAVKTPLWPVARWLPLAHAEAPLAGSMVLAGTVLKLSTYGFLRIILNFFPDATVYYSPIIQTICLISLIYASFATIRQTDFKALVAYSSISHMAVVTLGIFSNSSFGIEGAILLSVAHGLISPAMFMMVGGVLYDRYHTRVMKYYRGISIYMPIFSTFFFIITACNMGVPLSLNWLGEFIALSGIFEKSLFIGAFSAFSVLLSAIYSIWLYARITGGMWTEYLPVSTDMVRREMIVIAPLVFFAILFGVVPNFIINNIHISVLNLLYY